MNDHTATEALDAEIAGVDLLDLNHRDVQRLLAAADHAIEACGSNRGMLDDATLIWPVRLSSGCPSATSRTS